MAKRFAEELATDLKCTDVCRRASATTPCAVSDIYIESSTSVVTHTTPALSTNVKYVTRVPYVILRTNTYVTHHGGGLGNYFVIFVSSPPGCLATTRVSRFRQRTGVYRGTQGQRIDLVIDSLLIFLRARKNYR